MSGKLLPIWEPYRPANGTEGEMFMEAWCSKCARDNFSEDTLKGGCRILADTLFYDITDPNYPKEWVRGTTDGVFSETRCTAFVPRSELSERAKRAWQTRRKNASQSFSGDLFAGEEPTR